MQKMKANSITDLVKMAGRLHDTVILKDLVDPACSA
jgi:hypothetical protein